MIALVYDMLLSRFWIFDLAKGSQMLHVFSEYPSESLHSQPRSFISSIYVRKYVWSYISLKEEYDISM